MKIQPDSTITLYSGVEMGPGEQLVFSSRANQRAYYQSKVKKSFVNCTTVKNKYGSLKIAIDPEGHTTSSSISAADIAECNMLSFVNPSFDNKEIYCHIIDYNYINNECCEVQYFIDYFQTWMFDVDYRDMFIKREHLSVADWNKAEANPYDPSIAEFKTAEALPISKELEKPDYIITTGENTDAAEVKDGKNLLSTKPNELTNEQAVQMFKGGWSYYNVMLYISPINWDDLGASVKAEWEAILARSDVKYRITDDNGFIQDKDPNGGPNDKIIAMPWSTQPCCVYVLFLESQDAFETLINLFMREVIISTIVGAYGVPKQYYERSICGKREMPEGVTEPVFSDIDSEDDYSVKTSFNMMNTNGGSQVTVRNKKLLNYPFSYLRVIGPDGAEKEYHYERFLNVAADDEDFCVFKIVADISGNAPKMMIVPKDYLTSGIATSVLQGQLADTAAGGNTDIRDSFIGLLRFNLKEAMVSGGFPQIPYITDGYLTYLSNEYMAETARLTQDYAYALDKGYITGIADSTGTVIGGVNSMAGTDYRDITQMAAGGSAVTRGLVSGAATEADRTMAYNRAYEARAWRTGNYGTGGGSFELVKGEDGRWDLDAFTNWELGGDYPEAAEQVMRYEYTRPAHAASIYHPGNDGNINYYRGMGLFDFTALHVQLRESVLNRYDDYFDLYGYTSDRCGIPRALLFTQGATGNADTPHWVRLNGKDTTYVQTTDAKVEFAMLPVVNAIQNMLNIGVRFIKGDPT